MLLCAGPRGARAFRGQQRVQAENGGEPPESFVRQSSQCVPSIEVPLLPSLRSPVNVSFLSASSAEVYAERVSAGYLNVVADL